MRRLARQCIPATLAAKGAPASYGVSDYAVGRLSAKHINRVLLGADPGSLPAERLHRLRMSSSSEFFHIWPPTI